MSVRVCLVRYGLFPDHNDLTFPEEHLVRLSEWQKQQIRQAAARTLGERVPVRLFGSRLDDQVRGGDIDLYIELEGEPAEVLERELRFYAALQRQLGEQRIDLVVHRKGSALRPVDREALGKGVVL